MPMTIGSKLKQTISSLKGIQATLRIYAVQTKSEDARSAFTDALETTGQAIQDLEKRLQALEFEEPQYKGF